MKIKFRRIIKHAPEIKKGNDFILEKEIKEEISTREDAEIVPDNIENEKQEKVESEVVEKKTNKKVKKNNKNMIEEEKITIAEDLASELENKKILKKEKGLIERTESSKIILAEDNRQLLND